MKRRQSEAEAGERHKKASRSSGPNIPLPAAAAAGCSASAASFFPAQKCTCATGTEGLLELARSLPSTGRVLCAPPLWLAPEAATDPTKHRPPDQSDVNGDYTYLALGPEWQHAAEALRAAAEATYGGSAAVEADLAALRGRLSLAPGVGRPEQWPTTTSSSSSSSSSVSSSTDAWRRKGQRKWRPPGVESVHRGQFITPPAPVGLHVTIRAKCKPVALLAVAGVRLLSFASRFSRRRRRRRRGLPLTLSNPLHSACTQPNCYSFLLPTVSLVLSYRAGIFM